MIIRSGLNGQVFPNSLFADVVSSIGDKYWAVVASIMTTVIAGVAINHMRNLANRGKICWSTKPAYDVLQGVTIRHVNTNKGPVQVFDASTLGRLTPTAKTFVKESFECYADSYLCPGPFRGQQVRAGIVILMVN